ncbi:cupredoxin domain-containing protein [Caldibacillus kokeshiiformis]|nr:cupredoxin domain-containing protein [Pallidibacillus thermolactis subsp. kokeshiiformis]
MKVVPVSNENQTNREIQMITGEFVTETADGKKIEVYRFDPGTIYLKKGEEVDLKILGVNGDEHTFLIENTDIKGRIEKGKETIVPLQFDKPGTYRLICITHKDKKIKRITDL